MLVKCKKCSEKIDRDSAFKVVVNNKNSYYCDELEYLEVQAEKEARLKVFKQLEKIIGKTTNTVLNKEIKIIADVHTHIKLSRYLEDNLQELKAVLNKNFNSEYAKLKYLFAIIRNNIGDWKAVKSTREDLTFNIEMTEYKYKCKQRKKPLNRYIGEYLESEGS